MLSTRKAHVSSFDAREADLEASRWSGEADQLTLFGHSTVTLDPRGRRALEQLSEACGRMSKAVVCFQSAAFVEGLIDDGPRRPWIALPQGSQASRRHEHCRFIRWTNTVAFQAGVVTEAVSGIPIRRTGPARTVVDLVRYARHFRGLNPAVRAARRFVAMGGRLEEVSDIASQLRIPATAARSLELLLDALHGDAR